MGGYQLVGRLGTGGMGQVFLAVSPGGRRVAVKRIHPVAAGTAQLAVGEGNWHAAVWHVTTGRLALNLRVATGIEGVAFSPDGTLVATADRGHAYLWDVATGSLAGTFTDPTYGQVASVAFSPDGRLLAAADSNGTIYVRITNRLVS